MNVWPLVRKSRVAAPRRSIPRVNLRSLSLLAGATVLGVFSAALALRLRTGASLPLLAAGGLHVFLAGMVWLGLALVQMLQRPNDPAVRWFAVAGLGHALALTTAAVEPWSLGPLWTALVLLGWCAGAAALVGLVAQLAPAARGPSLLCLAVTPAVATFAVGGLERWALGLVVGLPVAALGATLVTRLRAPDLVVRQQSTWLASGLGLYAASTFVAVVARVHLGASEWVGDLAVLASVAAPVAVTWALQRTRLLEAGRSLVDLAMGTLLVALALALTARGYEAWADLAAPRTLALTAALGALLVALALRGRSTLTAALQTRLFPARARRAEALDALASLADDGPPARFAERCARRLPEVVGATDARFWWTEREGVLAGVDRDGLGSTARLPVPGRLWTLLTAFGAPMMREDLASVPFEAAELAWLDSPARATLFVPFVHGNTLVGVLTLGSGSGGSATEVPQALAAFADTVAPRLAARVAVARAEAVGRLRERVATLRSTELQAASAHAFSTSLQRVAGHLRLRAATGLDDAPEAGRALARLEELLGVLATWDVPRRARPTALRPSIDDALRLLGEDLDRARVEVLVDPSVDALHVQGEPEPLLLLFIDLLQDSERALADFPGPRRLELSRRVLDRNGRVGLTLRDTGHARGALREARFERVLARLFGTVTAEVGDDGGHVVVLTFPWAPPPA